MNRIASWHSLQRMLPTSCWRCCWRFPNYLALFPRIWQICHVPILVLVELISRDVAIECSGSQDESLRAPKATLSSSQQLGNSSASWHVSSRCYSFEVAATPKFEDLPIWSSSTTEPANLSPSIKRTRQVINQKTNIPSSSRRVSSCTCGS